MAHRLACLLRNVFLVCLYLSYISAPLCLFSLIHVTDRDLVPPVITDLVRYTASYTSIDIRTLSALLDASNWTALGPFTTKYTLFAPLDDVFEKEDSVVARLMERPWLPHLVNLLRSLVVPAQYSREDLLENTQAGSQNLLTLSGINQTISSSGDQLIISNGEFLEPSIQGVDG